MSHRRRWLGARSPLQRLLNPSRTRYVREAGRRTSQDVLGQPLPTTLSDYASRSPNATTTSPKHSTSSSASNPPARPGPCTDSYSDKAQLVSVSSCTAKLCDRLNARPDTPGTNCLPSKRSRNKPEPVRSADAIPLPAANRAAADDPLSEDAPHAGRQSNKRPARIDLSIRLASIVRRGGRNSNQLRRDGMPARTAAARSASNRLAGGRALALARLSACALAAIATLLLIGSPAVHAESLCTDTWTGPAEG